MYTFKSYHKTNSFDFDFEIYQYIDIDKNLACHGELTNQEIASAINNESTELDLEDEKSSDSDSVEVKIISSNEAKSAIVLLRSYLQQSRESCRTHLNSLDNIEDFIDKNKKLHQAKLESYFINLN